MAPVILRSNVTLRRTQVNNWLVHAPVAKLHLICFRTGRKGQDLQALVGILSSSHDEMVNDVDVFTQIPKR